MIDLKDTTFIIPIYIDSNDRIENTIINLSYLNKYLSTNIIVLEYGKERKVEQIIKDLKIVRKVKYIFIEHEGDEEIIFHRTKYINEMLNFVKTKVTCNLDIDILLKPESYLESQSKILEGIDLVYPYFWGKSQNQILESGRNKIKEFLDLSILENGNMNIKINSEYGQCQFFNTQSYIEGGMENEGFISYAPEDQERGYRFKKLDYKVKWLNNNVYHLEHCRGINSNNKNPMYGKNEELFEYIKSLSLEELKKYYQEQEYLKKYKK